MTETRSPGEQIRDAREAAGLPQAVVAARAAIARQATLSAIEHGSNVSLDTLQRLATALGVEIIVPPGLPPPRPDRPGRGKKKST